MESDTPQEGSRRRDLNGKAIALNGKDAAPSVESGKYPTGMIGGVPYFPEEKQNEQYGLESFVAGR